MSNPYIYWLSLLACLVGWGSLEARAEEPFSLLIPAEPPPDADRPAPNEDASSVEGMYYEASRLAMDNNYAEAIPLLEEIIEEAPSQLSAWELLGWAYWYTGQRERTERLWTRLRLLEPDDPRVYNWLASYHMGQDELHASIRQYEQSLGLDPDQPEVRFNLAKVYRWTGYLAESIQLLAPLHRDFPDREDIRLEYARALSSNWNYEGALPLWIAIRQDDPANQDYLVQEALCRLHTGDTMTARLLTEQALEKDPNNWLALQLRADLAEYGPAPYEAIPWLQRMLAAADSDAYREYVMVRLGALASRLHPQYPERGYVDIAIDMAARRIALEPDSVDARLSLAESYLQRQSLAAAEQEFIDTREEFNPNNLRGLRGLFETYMAMRRWSDAEQVLNRVKAFNPDDAYNHYYEAQLNARRGDYHAAYAALDALEARGRSGAVAVLLYHALGQSEHGQAPSQDEFREQLVALREAGYTFLSPTELIAYFREQEERDSGPSTGPIPRLATVTFDDALLTSLIYGTPVGNALGITMGQHVIVNNTERGDAYLTPWVELREYRETDVWEFGSHSFYSHQEMPTTQAEVADMDEARAYGSGTVIEAPIDEVARIAYPLANRIWNQEAGRLETREEYIQRLHREYGRSQAVLQERLGVEPRFLAYPFGEIGQEAASNVDDAIALNKKIGRSYYDAGFLQSYFGHAVAGDHPMLYQRYEMPLRASGEETVEHFILKNPVYLAQKTRLELAAEEGNYQLAMNTLEDMRASDYPEDVDEDLELFLLRNLVVKIPRSSRLFNAGTLFDWAWSDPFVGLRFELFEDNLDSEHHRLFLRGGMNLAPNVLFEAHAGAGRYEQPQFIDGVTETIAVDEQYVQTRVAALFPNALSVEGELGVRALTGDSEETVPAWALQAHGRLSDASEWFVRYEHDLLQVARTMPDGIDYDDGQLRTVWDLHERVDFWTTFGVRRHSDGNTRYQVELHPIWQLLPDQGISVGARYSYWSSSDERAAYWTPYNSHNVYGEVVLRGGRPGIYYSVDARVGLGREDSRIDDGGEGPGEPADEEMEVVTGLAGYLFLNLTDRLVSTVEVGHFRSPSYDETRGAIGLEFQF